MSKTKQNYIRILFFCGLLALVATPAFAQAEILGGLVPCGTAEIPCTPCHLWTLADNLVDFLLNKIAAPLLILAFLIVGIIWLTSSGNPKQIELGKKIITSGIFGILIAFSGWLIVDTLITTIGNGAFTAPWNIMGTCPSPAAATTSTTGATTPIPTPTGVAPLDNSKNANALVVSGVLFSGNGSCVTTSGQNVSAATNLNELQKGEGLTVCQNGCSSTVLKTCTKTTNTLDPAVLQKLLLAKNATNLNFTITIIATGDHAQNSEHYQFKAVDLVPSAPTPENYSKLKDQLRVFSPGTRIECENNQGNIVAGCGIGTTHLHATIK